MNLVTLYVKEKDCPNGVMCYFDTLCVYEWDLFAF